MAKPAKQAKKIGSSKQSGKAKRPKPAAANGREASASAGAAAADGSSSLETFLGTAGALTKEERLTIVNQAILLLEGFYVHLPLKRAMHGVDPLQRLRLLRHRLDQFDRPGGESRFHAEMTAIFTSVRDLHTNYLLPEPYNRVTAFLPFLVEACYEGDERRYIVTSTTGEMPDPAFQPGIVITHWNGVPIERAVANAADRHAGSNPAARHSRGLAGLTVRPLIVVPPPDEEWATVSYIGLDGNARETRFDWRTRGLAAAGTGVGAESVGVESLADHATVLGFDLETLAIQHMRQELFAPHVEVAQLALLEAGDPADLVAGTTDSVFPEIFTAKTVTTASGTFGHIRIRTFMVRPPVTHFNFVNEFVRLLAMMPEEGLILDVRDNGGGVVLCGERLLQTLTPKPIEPERLQFINTALTKLLVEANLSGRLINLAAWTPSIVRAVETGAAYSCSFPITDPKLCNDIGQRYRGPVVLITNARCYSTTDFFAAGFQDHKIGDVLGVDENTGAGGANVWDHGLLMQLLGVNGNARQPVEGSPLRPLPRGASMRVAVRRSLRVGAQAGTELEDLGVVPDGKPYRMTRRDLLEGNLDLIEEAGRRLARQPRYRLDAKPVKVGANLRITLDTLNIDRLDVELDGRPQRSEDIADGRRTLDLPTPLARGSLDLRGYKDGELVAARRERF